MLPYIYVVICLNISHFVGVLLHLFINFIPFAHSFPTVGPQVPKLVNDEDISSDKTNGYSSTTDIIISLRGEKM